MNENVIEWRRGQQVVAVTLVSGSKFAKKLIRLQKTHDDIDVKVNKDGSVFAHVPLKWIKISPPRQVSDEQKEAARIRLKEIRRQKEEQT